MVAVLSTTTTLVLPDCSVRLPLLVKADALVPPVPAASTDPEANTTLLPPTAPLPARTWPELNVKVGCEVTSNFAPAKTTTSGLVPRDEFAPTNNVRLERVVFPP